MSLETMDEQTLRRYLLGDVSSTDLEQVELWLMSDSEGYDLLVAAEDDLVDDFLSGQLSASNLQLFNNNFLATDERRRKLEFSRSLRRQLQKPTPQPLPERGADTVAKSGFQFTRRPVFRYAIAAVFVFLVVVDTWFMLRVVDLQRRLSSSDEQLADVVRDRDELKKQLSDKQSTDKKLQTQLGMPEATISAPKTQLSQRTVLALTLIPGVSRSSSDRPKITIIASTRQIQVSLLLLDDKFDRYGVSLLDGSDRKLRTIVPLRSEPTASGKAVVVTVPTALSLQSGDYSFQLTGFNDSGWQENLSRYYFQVVH